MADVAVVYLDTYRRFSTLGAGLTEAELAMPVPACPGWSAKDTLGHTHVAWRDDRSGTEGIFAQNYLPDGTLGGTAQSTSMNGSGLNPVVFTKISEPNPSPNSLHDAYHYYFGHYYAARALARLPRGEARRHAKKQIEIILPQREIDGSFVDAQMQGRSYSPAMALLTLLEDLRYVK